MHLMFVILRTCIFDQAPGEADGAEGGDAQARFDRTFVIFNIFMQVISNIFTQVISNIFIQVI